MELLLTSDNEIWPRSKIGQKQDGCQWEKIVCKIVLEGLTYVKEHFALCFCACLFIHHSKKYSWATMILLGNIPGTRDTAVHKTDQVPMRVQLNSDEHHFI